MDFEKGLGKIYFALAKEPPPIDHRPDLSGKEKRPNVKLFFGRRWGGCSREGFFWVSFFRGFAFVCVGGPPADAEGEIS